MSLGLASCLRFLDVGDQQVGRALLFGQVGLARFRRAGTSKTAVMVLELLMWSVLTSEVSMVPGCWLARNWYRKLLGVFRLTKVATGSQYWSPMVLDRFAHAGFSGSSGGLSGCGAIWQKPHDMLTRNGRTSLGSALIAWSLVGVVGILDACLPIAARLGRGLGVAEEVGIEEQPQADDAAGIAVDRRVEAVAGELGAHLGVSARSPGSNSSLGAWSGSVWRTRRLACLGVDILVNFGVGLLELDLIAIRLVEVEAEDLLVLFELGLHARLVDQPRLRKACAALARIQRMRKSASP